MDGDLLPIGQFARISRLSVKQLRRYDELGLLVPAYVDEQTGYRYYRSAQARQALSIGLLRSLDVPLAVIGQVLSGTTGALDGVRDDLETELARRRRTLRALERVMAEGLPSAQIRLVTEPARRVAVVKDSAVGPEDIGRATSAAIARLMSGASGLRDRQLIGLFPVDLTEPTPIAVALVTSEPVPGAEPDVLPGGDFACATHVGPYDQISLTSHALLGWCAEQRRQIHGPLREVYVSDPATTAPEQLVTHLLIPLEEQS
ncbi:MerR family transcriptional regulator [Sphaerisporangium perillae]|uniref:MerR family transcriptional regulator n=1 Tax=Sphaerisporangium perillae TaxID=2935860 RepID=UPI00200E42A2|nr:GyrI-like domain-containing protein [Sphaerisporangium perillae]